MRYLNIKTLRQTTEFIDDATTIIDSDARVANWFAPTPLGFKRDFNVDGFPILVKYKLDENDNFYLFYTENKDSDGALLPDLEKIQEEMAKNEKLNQEMKEKRKLKLIGVPSHSLKLKTFGSLENCICPTCRGHETRGRHFATDKDYFLDIYNFNNNINCDRCASNGIPKIQVSFLKRLIDVLSDDHWNDIYLALGAKDVTAGFEMKANQINDIHFEDLGISTNARILDINLTSNCHLFMLTPIPNNIRYTGTIIHDNILSFYATNFPDDVIPPSDENRLSVKVKWLNIDTNDLNDINLLNAIDNYIDNNPFELIMNANRTLELICNQICFKEFTKNNDTSNGKKSVEDFLVTGATYGHQLNHVLNLICKANNLVPVDKDLLSKFNWLRKLRNDIAHRGQLKGNRELTKNEKIEILAIAIFGSSLMKYIFERICYK